MCNYVYKHGTDKSQCIYPDFYKEHLTLFPLTKVLPIDNNGFCIFHSADEQWKKENGFKEKFEELFNVFINISNTDNKFHRTFNFSGFYFFEPLIINDFSLNFHFDFRFCEFQNSFVITNSQIIGWLDIRNANFFDTFKIKDVNFKNSFYGTNANFFNDVTFYNCQFESYTYLDDCVFRKSNKSGGKGFTIQSDNDKEDKLAEFKRSLDYLCFEKSRFEIKVNFRDMIFKDDVAFDNSTFLDEFYIQDCEVNGTISFNESSFLLSHIINPVFGTVDFRKIKLNKSGKFEFRGKEPLEDMVKGEMYMTFSTEPEGIVSFENFNLNKILPKHKINLLDLRQSDKVIIGKGCGIYRFRTVTKEIQILTHNQNLIEDFLETYSRFLTINKSISLGVEVEIKTINAIRFFYYTDDPNVSEEAFNKIFEEQTIENFRALTNSKNNNNNYEELETKLDANHIINKVALRKILGLWTDEDTHQLGKIESSGKNTSIIVNIINPMIDNSIRNFENLKIQGSNQVYIGNNITVNKDNKNELSDALKQEGLEDKISSLIEILETEQQDKINKKFGTKLKTWIEDIGVGVSTEIVKQILFKYLGWGN